MNINIDKIELLAVLKKNREEHREIFLEAQSGYREACIRELDKMLQEAREGKKIRTFVQLIEPMDQTKDYDRAIKMVEMSTDSTIKLEEREFESYVLDRWGWKKQWSASNAGYSSKLASMHEED